MGNYSMPRYFQNMPVVGKPVRANAENVAELKAIEEEAGKRFGDEDDPLLLSVRSGAVFSILLLLLTSVVHCDLMFFLRFFHF